jgi:hypothetical protein
VLTERHTELLQRAETAMFQAELAGPDLRESLLMEAKDTLIQVESVAPGRGAWLMACLNVRMGNAPLALRWLERAHHAAALPDRDTITASAYMKTVLRERWFQEFLAGID